MQFKNETGLPAKMFRGQPEPDVMLAAVAAKASFLIPSETALLPDVEGIEVHEDDVEAPFGYFPGDQVPLKPGVDLFVLGKAYAPRRQPTARMEVGLRLGSFERRLVVWGDRQWRNPREFTAPQPFLEMPVTYANAYGGQVEMEGGMVPFSNNPRGKGFIMEQSKVVGQPLPNIESPANPIQSWTDQPVPAGFGPFPRQTQIQAERSLRVVDAASGRFEMVPEMFFAGHPDMIVPTVEPGTDCIVQGMTLHGALRFRVPDLRLALHVRLGDKECRFALRLDTVCVLPEVPRVVLTYRASFRYRFIAKQVRATALKWGAPPPM